jgi:acyl carrier protein
MHNIEETIINIIKSILDTSDDIKKDAVIRNLGIDSIVFIQILVNIETQFNIEFPDEMLSINTMNTIDDMVETIRSFIRAGEEESIK